jgi:hypothetical protein
MLRAVLTIANGFRRREAMVGETTNFNGTQTAERAMSALRADIW